MRISGLLSIVLVLAGGSMLAAEAGAGEPAEAPIPAAIRAKVVSQLDGAQPDDVSRTPIPDLYEVTMGGLIAYVSADGKYLITGSIYDLASQTNLTASRRNAARSKALAALPETEMITFSPTDPSMTVTVFTDVDCGYCRKFHSQIKAINKAGVKVRYMMFPRTGPGTASWRQAEAVWCASDRKTALTRAKRGEQLDGGKCDVSSIKKQYELGVDLGVEGTPAIFTSSGEYIGGYLTPEQLVKTVRETEKTAASGG
jgi:thiol:disulfide interchange protein DsbC